MLRYIAMHISPKVATSHMGGPKAPYRLTQYSLGPPDRSFKTAAAYLSCQPFLHNTRDARYQLSVQLGRPIERLGNSTSSLIRIARPRPTNV